jgi:hypothetical protein
MSHKDVVQILQFEQDLKKMKANGRWLVTVMGVSEDAPAGYVLDGEAMSARFAWVPKDFHSYLVLKKEECQLAIDGDSRVRAFIESQAKRGVVRILISDLQRVLGPNWAQAVRTLLEQEEAKPKEE